ncbi:reticulon-like protein B9 isoform X2 [Cornus florida]|uniref:reticulon-like protein B9 isoform X2 n=1 Tax=Cornus florida TaxID=4283 RepID=UPI00289ABF0F|nr:reticulon-like protein B9 isoform X2 [Cornus florida]
MPNLLSDSDDDNTPMSKLFGRQRPIHALLGGGQVADVLLWRNKKVSATLLVGIAVIWFLFEVVEYNLVTLLSQFFITSMLVIFIWFKSADTFNWTTTPRIPEMISKESTFRDVSSTLHAKFNHFLSSFLYVACGNDPKLFFLAIVSLWILSVIGYYFSCLNLLFFGLLSLETLPFLYERYEEEVDYFAGRVNRRMRKMYKNFDSNFLGKIPKGPLKEKKDM